MAKKIVHTYDSVLRYDTVSLKGKVRKNDQGFVEGTAVVTRAGIFLYQNNDGTIRKEFRPPSEVFKKRSMDSLKLKPITNDHPPERLVDVDNAKDVQIGTTGETILQDQNDLLSSLVITDKVSIENIDDGKRELSCGYVCDVDEKTGVWESETYTHVQSNIIYNHLSLCDTARAGHGAKLNFQRNDAIQIIEGEDMKKVDKVVTDVSTEEMNDELIKKHAEILKAHDDLKACHDELTAKHQGLLDEYDAFKKKVDEAKAAKAFEGKETPEEEAKEEKIKGDALVLDAVTKERDALKAVVDSIPTKIHEAVAARRNLEVKAAACVPSLATKFDSMKPEEIKSAAIIAIFPTADLKDKPVEYIDARFDCAVEQAKANFEAQSKLIPDQIIQDSIREDKEEFSSIKAKEKLATK